MADSQQVNPFRGAFAHRLPSSLGEEAVLFNDISTILESATREIPKGDLALALAVLSNLSAAILRASYGEKDQLKEMAEWSCAAGRRANARREVSRG